MGFGSTLIHTDVFPPVTTSQNLATGSLSLGSGQTESFELIACLISFSGAVSQVCSVTYDSGTGANYDTVISTTTLSSGTSYFYAPEGRLFIPKGSNITLTCANSGTPAVTAYATILLVDIN